MNIIQIFENKCEDSPTVDTRLPPKWTWNYPKATHSKIESHVHDWPMQVNVTTSWNPTCPLWNPTCLLWVQLHLDLSLLIGVQKRILSNILGASLIFYIPYFDRNGHRNTKYVAITCSLK